MAEWWSIEVFDGEFPAARWRDAYSATLIESAIAHGAANAASGDIFAGPAPP
jgi:hypothetical protein